MAQFVLLRSLQEVINLSVLFMLNIPFKTISRGITDTQNMRHADTLQFTGVYPNSHKHANKWLMCLTLSDCLQALPSLEVVYGL